MNIATQVDAYLELLVRRARGRSVLWPGPPAKYRLFQIYEYNITNYRQDQGICIFFVSSVRVHRLLRKYTVDIDNTRLRVDLTARNNTKGTVDP